MSPMKFSRTINSWLSEKYGSQRGALLTYRYRSVFLLGGYRIHQQVDWELVDRLVFICKGNICRSAYAEAVARSLGANAISCGIDTVSGVPADGVAIMAASQRGYDLSEHKTTTMQSLSFNKADMLIAMEPQQLEYILANVPCKSCTLLGLWGSPITPHIHDPYGSLPAYFDNCFDYIEKSVQEIVRKISKS